MSRLNHSFLRHLILRTLFPVLLILTCVTGSYSQQVSTTNTDADTAVTVPVIKPVPLNRIAEEIQFTNALIKQTKPGITDPAFGSAVDSLIQLNKVYLDSISKTIDLEDLGKYREGLLIDFAKELTGKKQRMDNLKGRLSSYQAKLEEYTRTLTSSSLKWKITIDSSVNKAIPDELRLNIQAVRNNLDSMIFRLNKRSNMVSMNIGRLTAQIIYIDDLIQSIQKELLDFRKNLFTRNSPSLYRLYFLPSDTISFSAEFRQTFRHQSREQIAYLKTKGLALAIFLLIFFGLAFFLIYLRNILDKQDGLQDDQGIQKSMVVINHPYMSSLILTLYIVFFYLIYAPSAIVHLIFFLALPPFFLLLPKLFPNIPARLIYWYAVIFLLSRIIRVFNIYFILDSLTTLIMALGIVVFLIYLLRHWSHLWPGKKNKRDIYYYLAWVTLIIFLIVIAAEYIGYHRFSSFISISLVAVLNMAVFTTIAYVIIIRLIYFLFRMPGAKKINIIKLYGGEIYEWLRKVLKLVAFLYWLIPSLGIIRIKGVFFQWIKSTFTSPWKIEEMSLSLWDIILFVLVIYISVWLSRVIRILLQDELLERMKLPKGIPQAISMIVRVGLVTLGLVIALNILGINLDKITIIIGALGVGIGFGLQDIIRNLISGFIIAFERPINIGDTIQLSSLNIFGIVKSIGIRSSIIKSYDGAEVIIPNGNLISNEMINWTHSDHLKRQEIRVGVAYSSDLDKVLEVLKKATDEEENVLKEPETMIIFEGFQDSSIEFRVLFWAQVEIGFTTKTAVALRINRLLNEAGIVIPFPQRDLYLKSVPKEKNIISTDKATGKQSDIKD